MSGTTIGLITALIAPVGVLLGILIKTRFDRWSKQQDVSQIEKAADDTNVRADLKTERDASSELRKEMNVLREEADRERDLRVAEGETYRSKSREMLADIEKMQGEIRRVFSEMNDMQVSHEATMKAQRDANRQQMQTMRDRHELDLARRDNRIAVLTDWINGGNPPPPPDWVMA